MIPFLAFSFSSSFKGLPHVLGTLILGVMLALNGTIGYAETMLPRGCQQKLSRHTHLQTQWSQNKRGWLKPYVSWVASRAEPCLTKQKASAMKQLQTLEIREDALTLVQLAEPMELLPEDRSPSP
ncbi:MAG: hypothetical protein ACKO37_09735 [Vampirovibrionales bacterium]